MIIIYNSNAGHTKDYAEMIGKRLNIPYYSYKEIKNKYQDEEVIYMSWIFGGMIMNYNKIRKNYNIKTVIAVGATLSSDEYLKELKEKNNIDNLYYLRGGIEYSKLKGIKKKMIKMISNQAIKKGDEKALEIFDNTNHVEEKNIENIIKYLEK